MKPEDTDSFHIYVDETSKSATFMGVGALLARKDSAREIALMVQDAVPAHGQRHDKEIHWTELTNHLLPLYRAIGPNLIGRTQIKPYRMRYHILMIERSKLDRSISAGLNKEEVLERFIFTLIFLFAARLGPKSAYHVFIDSPDGTERDVPALRAMLNNRSFSHFRMRTNPFRTVKYVRSENSRLIQAVDLLSGAVAYETNSLHLAAKPSKPRYALWQAMLQASNLPTFAQPTRNRMNRFQIMHFDFEKSAAKRFKNPPAPLSDDK